MSCKPGEAPLTNEQWINVPLPDRCFFYPGRECPGWADGGVCSRMGDLINASED